MVLGKSLKSSNSMANWTGVLQLELEDGADSHRCPRYAIYIWAQNPCLC